MRISPNARIARKLDSRPMENRENIMTISLSYLGYKLCRQTLFMQGRCAIEPITNMSLVLSKTFLMAPITSRYSTLLSLLVWTIRISTFLINATLHLAFRRTVFLHSRRVGPSFFSTSTFLLKYAARRNIAFMLPQSLVRTSLGIGIRLLGRSFKN